MHQPAVRHPKDTRKHREKANHQWIDKATARLESTARAILIGMISVGKVTV
jgi:hypothetical protein